MRFRRARAITLEGMEFMTALGAGAVAGFALVVPLGAIGVLLIQEGASRGWVKGVPAATAVATVDMLYCVAAVSAGLALASLIASWSPWPRIIGGAALVALAAWNLIRARRSNATPERGAEPGAAPSSHRYALFFALTAINPATLVYFAAIVTGLSTVSTSLGIAAVFVVGVTLASLSWQLILVSVGAIVRWKTGARFDRLTTLIGNSAVAILGGLMLTGIIF